MAQTVTVGGSTVLVVEDNNVVGDLLKRLLENEGVAVKVVETGEDAVQTMKMPNMRHRISAVFSDWKLPGRLSGIDVGLAARMSCPEAPLILMTGFSCQELSHRAAMLSPSTILAKPFDLADLYHLLLRFDLLRPRQD